MWVYLDNWMVQDGEIPELRVGDTLRGAAVRAACLSLHQTQADAAESLEERPDPDTSSGRVTYHVTGTVERCREPHEVLLRVGGVHFMAVPADVRQVPGTSPSEYVLERYSFDFKVPPVGARVTAACTWEVLAEYEIEFEELQTDWWVRELRIERRGTTPVALQKSKLLRVDTVDQLHRWADEREKDRITYLLDLEPVTPGSS